MRPDVPRWVRPAIFTLSLCGLLSALLADGVAKTLLCLCSFAGALFLFYRWCTLLMGLSADNPKVRTSRTMTWLSVFLVLLLLALAACAETLEQRLGERAVAILLCVVIAFMLGVFGNLSPTIPFNRYFGLRLPWTIRDEATWRMAHRLLGQITFPCAAAILLLCALIPDPEALIKCSMIPFAVWVLLPSLYSLWFYCRRYRIGPKWLYKN